MFFIVCKFFGCKWAHIDFRQNQVFLNFLDDVYTSIVRLGRCSGPKLMKIASASFYFYSLILVLFFQEKINNMLPTNINLPEEIIG